MSIERGARRANSEGSYYTRPDGRIQFQIMIEGTRVTAYGKTKREAKAKARSKVELLGERRAPVLVEGLYLAWVEEGFAKHRLAPSTFDQYRFLIATRVVPVVGGKRVDGVTRRAAADAFRGMSGSASTLRSTYAAWVKLFDYAVDSGLVGVNVVRDVKRPQSPVANAREISREQAQAVLAAAVGHRWSVAAWLSLGAGMRRGEILGLTWNDIDLDAGTAKIEGNVTRTSAGLTRGEPKTRRGRRIVPLDRSVLAELRRHRSAQLADRLRLGDLWLDSGHVLTSELGGIVEPRSLSRAWQAWAEAAGISDTGMHVGRHFAASLLLASGRASVADVAAMLGHDPSVLLGTYASAVADGQRAAASVLGDVLSTPIEKWSK